MFKWLKDAFRFDGIQDNELPPNSTWVWLTPMERIGVQSYDDLVQAKELIKKRQKAAKFHSINSGDLMNV